VLHDLCQFAVDAEATVSGLRSVEGIHVFNQHVHAGLLTVHGACCAEVPIAVTAVTVFIEGMGVHCLSFLFIHYTRLSDNPNNLSMVLPKQSDTSTIPRGLIGICGSGQRPIYPALVALLEDGRKLRVNVRGKCRKSDTRTAVRRIARTMAGQQCWNRNKGCFPASQIASVYAGASDLFHQNAVGVNWNPLWGESQSSETPRKPM
jgi:hypothetical protein